MKEGELGDNILIFWYFSTEKGVKWGSKEIAWVAGEISVGVLFWRRSCGKSGYKSISDW